MVMKMILITLTQTTTQTMDMKVAMVEGVVEDLEGAEEAEEE